MMKAPSIVMKAPDRMMMKAPGIVLAMAGPCDDGNNKTSWQGQDVVMLATPGHAGNTKTS